MAKAEKGLEQMPANRLPRQIGKTESVEGFNTSAIAEIKSVEGVNTPTIANAAPETLGNHAMGPADLDEGFDRALEVMLLVGG